MRMKKVGIVACSNALEHSKKEKIAALRQFLTENGAEVVTSSCIFEKNGPISGTARERAAELMKMFADPEIEEIYDVSGGDMANQVLDFLDFEVIKNSKAVFWGYSDLSTLDNAIYTATGKPCVLYQARNVVRGTFAEMQKERFLNREELFNPTFYFIQGDSMEGIVVGGNIRCFLKLAGTRFWPDFEGKLLLLEAWGGEVPQMSTYLAQYNQLGVFEKVKGIILGTFTMMESKNCRPDIVTLVKEYAGDLPIAVTREIGHGHDAKAIWIGRRIEIK